MGDSVILLAVGDIMLSENRGTGAAARKRGSAHLFARMRPLLDEADLRVGNLETLLSAGGAASGLQDPHVTFRASPDAIEGLRHGHFDVLSLANNHMGDYGEAALLDTLRILDAHGIERVGAGRTAAEAHRGIVVERKGLRIGFLAYSMFVNVDTRPASRRRGGIALFDRRRAALEIDRLRSRADIVAVCMHWGLDFTEYPVPFQMERARELIDRGAHLVLGHHPHFLQGTERYRHGFIAYSLGDFVFDEPGQDALMLRVELSRAGVGDVDIVPARIGADFVTEPVDGVEGARIRRKVAGLSAACQRYDPAVARRMTDDFVKINLRIFLESGNLHALRNVWSPGLLWRVGPLLLRRARKPLRTGLQG